jgi:hypothetical protein
VRPVWPDAGPATTPVSFMLFISSSVIRQLRAGCVDWHVTVLALGVRMRTLAVRRPGFRRGTAQRERPHRDYSVSSAGRRSGSPSRGNRSLWNVMISVIARR